MPFKYIIQKVSAQGEQIAVTVDQCNPVTGEPVHSRDEVETMLKRGLEVCEDRLFDMNIKTLEASGLLQMLPVEVKAKVIDILDVLCGRQDGDGVRRRWESAIEETQELENARQEAYEASLTHNGNEHAKNTE